MFSAELDEKSNRTTRNGTSGRQRRERTAQRATFDDAQPNQHPEEQQSSSSEKQKLIGTTFLVFQRLMNECEKLKIDRTLKQNSSIPEIRRNDSINSENNDSFDNLQSRLKNISFDAARQRKLNKTLQTDNENLTKNLQSLTEK